MHRDEKTVRTSRQGRRASYSLLIAFFLLISNAHAGLPEIMGRRFASLFFTSHRTGLTMVEEFLTARNLVRAGATAEENFGLFTRELLAATDAEAIAMRRGLEQRLTAADDVFEAQRRASSEMSAAQRQAVEREFFLRAVIHQFGADVAAANEAANVVRGGAEAVDFVGRARPSIWQQIRSRFLSRPTAPGMATEPPAPASVPTEADLAAALPPVANEGRLARFLRHGLNTPEMEACLNRMPQNLLNQYNSSTYMAEMARTIAFTGGGYAITHGVTDFDSFVNMMMEVGINGFLTHRSLGFYTAGRPQSLKVYWMRSVKYSFREQMPVDMLVYTARHGGQLMDDPTLVLQDLGEREAYNSAWALLNPATPLKSVVHRYFLGVYCMTHGLRGSAAGSAWRIAISAGSTLGYFGIRHALGAD
jgi:hypothetical protein